MYFLIFVIRSEGIKALKLAIFYTNIVPTFKLRQNSKKVQTLNHEKFKKKVAFFSHLLDVIDY